MSNAGNPIGPGWNAPQPSGSGHPNDVSAKQAKAPVHTAIIVALTVLVVLMLLVILWLLWKGFVADQAPASSKADKVVTSQSAAQAQSSTPQSTGPAQSVPRVQAPSPPSETLPEPRPIDAPPPTPWPGLDEYGAPLDTPFVMGIESPSGNIRCVGGSGGMTCTIGQQYWAGTAYEVCGGGLSQYSFALGDAGVEPICMIGDFGDVDFMVLDYGQTARSGSFACTSYVKGMTCWHQATGASIALAREGWMTGIHGPIPEEAMPW